MLQFILIPLLAAVPATAAVDVDTVAPGQRGVCITEWDGGERIEIPVEVVGTMDGSGPERDAVLVRILDPRFADAGLAAGMSGSPVFIDGKLLGALAFGWPFAREPLAGVTPIDRMRDITRSGSPAGALSAGTTLAVSHLASLASGELNPDQVMAGFPHLGSERPIAVSLSGLPLPDSFGSAVLRAAGLEAVAGAGTTEESSIPEPGEMVAALLAWGDATMAAAGTVTERDGSNLLAFGHPLFGLGDVNLPAARARVLAVQRSYQLAFKLYQVGAPFGGVVADRPAGILVDADQEVAGVPLTVTVKDSTGEQTWHFQVAPTPLLQPLLVTFLVNASLTARGAMLGDATVVMKQTAALEDGRTVSLRHAMQGPDSRARTAALAGALMDLLTNSNFPGPRVAAMDVTLEQREDAPNLRIIQAIPSRTSLRAGQQLAVSVRLQPRNLPAVEKRLLVTVPKNTPPGNLDLIVADGAAWGDYQVRQRGISPTRFDDQLAALEILEPSTNLVAALERRDRGIAVAGRPQPALPPSWAATLALGLGRTGVQRLITVPVSVTRWEAPAPVVGAVRIPLTILDGPQDDDSNAGEQRRQ